MGKKSKRRGGGVGGGKAKAAGGRDADQPLVPYEALMQVTAPKSLKGIFSTNDEPTSCVFCKKSVFLGTIYLQCCGAVKCRTCPEFIVDICGNDRCASCNTPSTKILPILHSQASLGKAWAQHMLGNYYWCVDKFAEAQSSFIQSALKGNFASFLSLSEMCCQGKGMCQDLRRAEAYARKARALNAECGLSSNLLLIQIAAIYSESGAQREANDLLLGVMDETDESALDADLCEYAAVNLYDETPHLTAEMHARSFYYGRIESALSASLMFYFCQKYALSKLWLDVACKSKSLYTSVVTVGTGETMTWADYDENREPVRSHLREMRNSCGGCGTALSGDRRKYCRCCRTYCYCNENCQKKHWESGHREECKEVEEHMRDILRAIRLGRFDWVQKRE